MATDHRMLNRHWQEAQVAYCQLLSFYGETLGANGTDNKQVQSRRDGISFLLMQFLCQCVPQERFRFTEFPSIIYNTAAANVFRPDKAASAFLNLEHYLLLLCLMPWKREYHKIKKFGGFYQSKIESHLRNVESIFKLVGFQDNRYGGLFLSNIPDTNKLQDVAFECFIASVECKIIENVCFLGVTQGITPFLVVEVRSQHSGTAEEIYSRVEQKQSKKANCNESDGVIVKAAGRSQERADQQSFTTPFRNKLEGYMRTAKEHSSGEAGDIPYIDEDEKKDAEFSEGTLDYHLLASLQIVGDKEVTPAKPADPSQYNTGGSQEWSFVREGLEKNYGRKYFDGPRKDILTEKEGPSDKRPYLAYNRPMPAAGVDRPNLVQTVPGPSSRQITVDSAYLSQSSTYPPSTVSRQALPVSMVSPTVRHPHTDVIRKSPDAYSEAKPDFSKTVPLLRRPARGVSDGASRTYPGMSTTAALYSPLNTPHDMDNIKAYQKQSSIPLATSEYKVPMNSLEQQQFSSNINKIQTRSISYDSSRSTSATDNRTNITSSSISKPMSKNIPISNVSGTISVTDSWPCRYCTYLNRPESVVCDMCSKTRDGQLEMDSPAVGDVSKVCNKCTLENKTRSIVCHACGNQLSVVHTVV